MQRNSSFAKVKRKLGFGPKDVLKQAFKKFSNKSGTLDIDGLSKVCVGLLSARESASGPRTMIGAHT